MGKGRTEAKLVREDRENSEEEEKVRRGKMRKGRITQRMGKDGSETR